MTTLPGRDALSAYLCKVMADGQWRTTNDFVMRMKDDNMIASEKSIASALGALEGLGRVVHVKHNDNFNMWKLRR
jgi:hypothetical protein